MKAVARELKRGRRSRRLPMSKKPRARTPMRRRCSATRVSGGHTIVAEYQRRGAGRKGRVWLAPAGTALLFTTILPRSVDYRQASGSFRFGRLWRYATRCSSFGVDDDAAVAQRSAACAIAKSPACSASPPSAERRRDVACGVGINVRRPGADSGNRTASGHSATTSPRSTAPRCCAHYFSNTNARSRRSIRRSASARNGMRPRNFRDDAIASSSTATRNHLKRSPRGLQAAAAYA